MNQLLKNIEVNNPPSEEEIAKLLEKIDFQIDPELWKFMIAHNGGTGFLGDDDNVYIDFWPVADMLQFNPYYVEKDDDGFSKTVFIFASNGSDAAFAIKKETRIFYEIPYLDMDEDGCIFLGNNFDEFLHTLSIRQDYI